MVENDVVTRCAPGGVEWMVFCLFVSQAIYGTEITADVVITCGGGTSEEAKDRASLRLDQDNFISDLARRHAHKPEPKPRLVVLAMAPGAILAPWAEDVDAVMLMFFGGQAQGDAWADVLLGRVNPSGKLPVTIPNHENDALMPCTEHDCVYEEGVNAGWHRFERSQVAFPFGYGLSYTEFAFEWATFSNDQVFTPASALQYRRGHTDAFTMGKLEVYVTVSNTGTVSGSEVLQLYIQFPEKAAKPPHVLMGFAKTRTLLPGKRQTVHIELKPQNLFVWSPEHDGQWDIIEGGYTLFVGSSSQDFKLVHTFDIENEI